MWLRFLRFQSNHGFLAIGLLGIAVLIAVVAVARSLAAPNDAEPAATLPSGWNTQDVGAVTEPGRVDSLGDGRFRISARNWLRDDKDAFHFVYTQRRGNFVATCRLRGGSEALGLGGLMVRATLEPNSRYAALGRSAYNKGYNGGHDEVQTRTRYRDGGQIVGTTAAPADDQVWVRLSRFENNVAAYWSRDGKIWNLCLDGGGRIAPEEPGLPEEVLVGIFAAAKDDAGVAQHVDIDSVTVEPFRPPYVSTVEPFRPPYVSSWLGNSWGGTYSFGHVQMQVTALCVEPGPTPRLRMIGPNEAKDSSVFDTAGNLLATYQLDSGMGTAIASDGKYVYESHQRDGWMRLSRIGTFGKDVSPKTVLEKHLVRGVAAGGGKVYASEATTNRVHVFEAETMKEISSFAFARPGHLALDREGNLWIVRRAEKGSYFIEPPADPKDGWAGNELWTMPAAQRGEGPQVFHVRPDGSVIAEDTITFAGDPGPVEVTQIAVSPADGRLYVCDAGRAQCVRIFGRRGKPAGRLGAVGGVYAAEIPGRLSPDHLYFPRAIALDASGAVYVSLSLRTGWNGGNLTRKYDASGNLDWERYGLEFQECADVDPGTDGRDAFTQQHHYRMDYGRGPGKEATFTGITYDPFTYPKDARNTWDGGAVNATAVRRIGGRRVMFLHQHAREGEYIYRFAEGSEIAIPCGWVSNRGFWIDANGDGVMDKGEVGPGVKHGICWTVDAGGDIWSCEGKEIRCYRQQGLNARGAPVYTREPTETYATPEPYTDAQYVLYDPHTDSIFLGGFTDPSQRDANDHGGTVGTLLSCYSNVRASNGFKQRRWSTPMPYARSKVGREVDAFTCAAYAGDRNGGYVFVGGHDELGVGRASIRALRSDTGRHVQTFLPGPENGGYSGWLDFNNAINAYRKSDGEYLIFAEDDGAQKVNFYRWRP